LLITCTKNAVPVSPNPFYTVQVAQSASPVGLPYQAFATGRKGDTILLLTGRTNGFHNFPSVPVASFPSNRSNDSFVVYIPAQNKIYKASLTTLLTPTVSTTNPLFTNNQIYQLASTNIQSCQNGDTLYGIGGYGYNGSMITFGGCFAVNIPNMINLVIYCATTNPSNLNTDSATIVNAISFATNKVAPFYVTGGELLKTSKGYYLVVGQRFDGEYSNGAVTPTNLSGYLQKYTSSIIPYSFNWSNNSTFSYTVGTPIVDPNNLHRRDLNVVPVIDKNGNKEFHIYGGVFTTTKFGGPYLNPVEFSDTLTPAIKVNSMNQYFNQYAAAHISIYDTTNSNNQMLTTILGGITLFDKVGQSNNNDSVINLKDTTMPWSKVISTMVKIITPVQ